MMDAIHPSKPTSTDIVSPNIPKNTNTPTPQPAISQISQGTYCTCQRCAKFKASKMLWGSASRSTAKLPEKIIIQIGLHAPNPEAEARAFWKKLVSPSLMRDPEIPKKHVPKHGPQKHGEFGGLISLLGELMRPGGPSLGKKHDSVKNCTAFS